MTLTADEARARAIRLQELLNDADIKAALASIEADLTAEWRSCGDPEGRDNIWRALNVMERLQTWMRSGAAKDLRALKRTK